GHLAALLGTSADIPELEGPQGDNQAPGSSTRVHAVVTISAPTDFLQLGHDRPDSAEALLIGGSLHAKQDLVRMANPITYVHPNPPPFLIIHGEEDDVVPIGQSQLLYQALQQLGGDVTFVPLPGEGHMLGDIYDTQVEPMIRNFFIKHLKR
ncbi:MAG TPA: prolyl oligopeptidase family serine peptidase, partial [Solirubrobacteraceae bacterium]